MSNVGRMLLRPFVEHPFLSMPTFNIQGTVVLVCEKGALAISLTSQCLIPSTHHSSEW
jgi:hypothetical protein